MENKIVEDTQVVINMGALEEQSEERMEHLITLDEAIADRSKIKIAKHIPFEIKNVMIEQIINSCMSEDVNGLLKVNYAIKALSLEYTLAVNYTNINFTESEIFDSYNKLVKNGLIEYIFNEMEISEYSFIEAVLDNEIEQAIRSENSIEGIISKGINTLISKIPDEEGIANIISSMKNFDPEKMTYIKNVVELLNGDKKTTKPKKKKS